MMGRTSIRRKILIVVGSMPSLAALPVLAGVTGAGDFNGDGFSDLAIGVPNESVGALGGAGSVNVIYGSSSGLNARTPVINQLWHQNKSGIEDDAEASDTFGSALATGDFDGDGFMDLAIGVPGENTATGAVNIIYGSANGLRAAGDQFFSQSSPNIEGNGNAADLFGSALAAGDFNGDGFWDLAIGITGESEFGPLFHGAVSVIYGSANGLSATAVLADQILHQDTSGIDDSNEFGDGFGTSLAAGDFNGDGRDDLAIGVPNESIGTTSGAGAVHMLLGSASGLTATGSEVFHQNTTGIQETAETNDSFGAALAAGDFNGDGRDDLAIGVPSESIGASPNAGAVHVLLGGASGLVAAGSKLWHQDSAGILEQTDGGAKDGEGFGFALAAGFFNNGAFCDLAIGAPNEDLTSSEEGVVHVLYGKATGLGSFNNQLWHQDSVDSGNAIADTAEEGDHFGAALAAGDFNGDGKDDLVIGVPQEQIGNNPNCGAVAVLKGAGTKLKAAGNKLWHQNKPDILEKCEMNDSFGQALAP
jgi:hypothetical protein